MGPLGKGASTRVSSAQTRSPPAGVGAMSCREKVGIRSAISPVNRASQRTVPAVGVGPKRSMAGRKAG